MHGTKLKFIHSVLSENACLHGCTEPTCIACLEQFAALMTFYLFFDFNFSFLRS